MAPLAYQHLGYLRNPAALRLLLKFLMTVSARDSFTPEYTTVFQAVRLSDAVLGRVADAAIPALLQTGENLIRWTAKDAWYRKAQSSALLELERLLEH